MKSITLRFTVDLEDVTHHRCESLKLFFEKELLDDLLDIWMGDIEMELIDFSLLETNGEIIVHLLSEYEMDEEMDGMTFNSMLRAYNDKSLYQRVEEFPSLFLEL